MELVLSPIDNPENPERPYVVARVIRQLAGGRLDVHVYGAGPSDPEGTALPGWRARGGEVVYTPECPRERGPWRELRSRDQNFKFMATSVCVAGLSLDDHRLHGDVLRYVAESPWFGDSHSVARTAGDAAVWTPRVETDVATAVRDWSTLALGSETAHARGEGPVNEESEHQATADRQRRPVQATLRSMADPSTDP